MRSGIYKITNAVNNKCYIGSSIHIDKRFTEHLCMLKGTCHDNPHLQNAWNKYKEESFSFEILLFCNKENLTFFESRAIAEHKSLEGDSGYNCRPAQRFNLTGSNAKRWKAKISRAHKGRKASKKARQNMSKAQKGKKHTDKTKKKMSERIFLSGKQHPLSGKVFSLEHRQKLSKAMKDRRLSKEHLRRMSEVRIGKNIGAKNSNARAVIINGKYYGAIIEAIRDLGISRSTMWCKLKTNKPGYSWA